jgi:uncharacterized protein YlxW (UPF0749 family)
MVAITAVCLVLGALLGVQVRTEMLRGETAVGRRSNELLVRLATMQAELDNKDEEIAKLRSQITHYERAAADEKGVARLANELQKSRIAIGLLPMTGFGVELVVGDSTMDSGSGVGDQEAFVIHDFDLMQIANELWAAGAEAISLNGQRLITGSAITCSGRLIQVNKVTVSGPFTFLAIGNRDNLTSSLNIRDGILDRLRWLKFQVKLTPKEVIVVPAAAIAPKYQYAKPVAQEKSTP